MKTKTKNLESTNVIESNIDTNVEILEATNDNTNDLSAKEVLNGHFSLAEILAQRSAKVLQIEATKATKTSKAKKSTNHVTLETLMYLHIFNKGLEGITFDQIMNVHGKDGNLLFNDNTMGMEFNTNDLILRLEKRFTNPCMVNTKYTKAIKDLETLNEKLKVLEVVDNNFEDLQEIAETINNLENLKTSIEIESEKLKLPIYFEVSHEQSKVRFLSNGNGKLNNRVKLLHFSCYKPLYDYLISKNVTPDMITVTESDFIED